MYLFKRFNKVKTCLIAVVFLFCFSKTEAQFIGGTQVIPVSPNIANLGGGGKAQNSMYTGSASASIPIYTINLDGKDIPIQLSYNNSGTKVAQEASWVGLGWNLNVAGSIVRDVKGLDDFGSGGYIWDNDTPWNSETGDGFEINSVNYYQYLKYYEGIKDPEPDIFHFDFGGFSGKMFFGKSKSAQNTTAQIKPLIHSADVPLDIIFNTGPKSWVVRDGQGYIYYFGTKEETKTFTLNSNRFLGEIGNRMGGMANTQGAIVTSWQLDSIESPKKNKVYFHYKNESIYTPMQMAEEAAILDDIVVQGSDVPAPLILNYNYSFSEINQFLLTKIDFREGNIVFNSTDRSDIEITAGSSGKAQKLSSIEVRSYNDELVKKVDLGYHYMGNDGINGRLILESVSEGENGNVSKYTLSYDEKYLPPKYSLQTDAWGYYNNSMISTNPNELKITPTVISENMKMLRKGADKKFISGYASAGLLNKITYPTGGSSHFFYEPHYLGMQVSNITEDREHAIGFIDNMDVNTGQMIMEQKVEGPTFELNGPILRLKISAGHDNPFPVDPYPNNPSTEPSIYYSVDLQKWNGQVFNTVASNANIKVGPQQPADLTLALERLMPLEGKYRFAIYVRASNPEVYVWTSLKYLITESDTVKKEQYGAGFRVAKIVETAANGQEEKKEYKYSEATLMAPFIYSAGIISHQFLPQYPHESILSYYWSRSYPFTQFASTGKGNIGYSTVTESSGNGSTVYNFENFRDKQYNAHLFPGLPSTPNFTNGFISSIEIKDNQGILLKKDQFEYRMKQQKFIFNAKLISTSLLPSTTKLDYVAAYPLEIQNWRKVQKISTTYVKDQAPIRDTSSYLYDTFLQENTVVNKRSDGLTIKSETKLPNDFADLVNKGMVNKFMVSVPIEFIRSVDGNVVQAEKIVYKDTLGMFLPHAQYKFYSQKPQPISSYINFYKMEKRFNRYNSKGNIQELILKNGIYTSYIWDTKNLYLIAMINNGKLADLSLPFSGYNMTGTSVPDEAKELYVRSQLPQQQVTTYTYKPLVGMTSKTDARGITEYYKYDGMQRLQAILDHLNYVNRSFDYHYRSN